MSNPFILIFGVLYPNFSEYSEYSEYSENLEKKNIAT